MTTNADNAMARFLFAILKQKNLKDIDWTKVAEDPVLLQPITNGHAARMRYSRFRSTILGHEPQKRSSRPGDKAKVSKPSKRESSVKKEPRIKSESDVDLSSLAQFSSASVSPYMGDLGDDFTARFLTPCSDDMTQSLSIRPSVVDGFGLDYATTPSFLKDEPGLDDSPDFSAFDPAYDISNYTNGTFDLHSQPPSDMSIAPSLMDSSHDWSHDFHEHSF